MGFVIDASVAITWAMSDEDHPTADLAFKRVQTDSAVVPAIWWYEVRNVLLMNERRNRISRDDCDQFLSDLSDFDIELHPLEYSHQTVDLARRYKLSVYDAAYLALALELGLPLATLDQKLRDAASAVNVELLG